MINNNYFDIAENDYMYYKDVWNKDNLPNSICAVGQSICERYLKHLINEYYNPADDAERKRQADALHSHSLSKICSFIRQNTDIPMDVNEKDKILKADGYYFTTRYPGDEFMVIEKDDIRRVAEAVEYTRTYVMETEKELLKYKTEDLGGNSGDGEIEL